jgi:hypothetical protein
LQFAFDPQTGNALKRITRFSGWCLSADGRPAKEVLLSVNGEPLLRLIGSPRADVAAAFPIYPFARSGGFVGDVVLPESCRLHDEISITIEVKMPDGERKTIYSRDFFADEPAHTWPVRNRNYDLVTLLQDPYTGRPYQASGPLELSEYRWSLIAGTPHFHPRSSLPAVRLLEQGVTHPWGEQSRQLISELKPTELFLDFGAGIKRPEDLAPNAVFLDAVHFPNIDVVNSADNIPFRPNSFDLVISQAVFEHLPNPFQSAKRNSAGVKAGWQGLDRHWVYGTVSRRP